MRTLHVSAGGNGERIAGLTSAASPSVPKHLLSLPTKHHTILGEIVGSAIESFNQIIIWANEHNRVQIANALINTRGLSTEVDEAMSGPLGPMVRSALSTGMRTYGCAGDFYCNFSWEMFEQFHDIHGLPVSVLIAKSVPAPGGARFLLEEGRIIRWQRVEQTTEHDQINIGCYIIDPTPEVVAILRGLQGHKEDLFFDAFVSRGLVTGYDPGILGFNVNIAAVYHALLRTLE